MTRCPVELERLYRSLLDLRDRTLIELISVERSVYMCDMHRLLEKKKGLLKDIHEFKLHTQRITYALEYVTREAQANGLCVDLEEIASRRHKSYGENHPVILIRPYLNLEKLHVYYLDLYPGLGGMEIGSCRIIITFP